MCEPSRDGTSNGTKCAPPIAAQDLAAARQALGRPNDEYIRTLHCDPESLKRAVEFFGLNKDMELNPAVKSDVFLLAVLLAEELFGKRKRGPKSGNNLSWDAERFLKLGFLYEELKSDCPQSSDTEIAAIIAKDPEFKEYRSKPDLIRQRLPEAKRKLAKWQEDYAMDMTSQIAEAGDSDL